MSVTEYLLKALTRPTAVDLWHLRADLLEAGLPTQARVFKVIDEFHHFLDQLATGNTSREYSHLASMMDIGAVSGVVLEHAFEQKQTDDLALRLMSVLLSEGLMVLGTRQHVKAWESELAAVYGRTAWYLYEELWGWVQVQKPELPPQERRRLLDLLFAPIHSAEISGAQKTLLLGRLFQLILLSYLPREIHQFAKGGTKDE